VVPLLDLEAGRKYQLGEPDNSEFPWINPNGGTRGIKPDRNHEKKTVEAGQHVKRPSEKKAVSETSPPSHDDPETTPANPEPRDVEPQAAESPVTEPGPETGDIDETPAAAEDEAAPEIQGEAADDTGLASVDEEQKRQDGVSGQDDVQYEYIPQDESEPPQHPVRVIEAREPNMLNRRTLLVSLAAIIIAVLLSIMIGTYSSEPALTEDVKNKLVEAERIKQELAKMQELQQQQYREMQKQAEELKREREAAKALAELEEQKRAEEAASKEREAIEAAALAAEKALKAAQQAEKLARQQQLEDKRLKAELSRIEKERKKAELEKQQLEIKRQQAELEKQRLERERLAAERKARVQWEEAAAREQEALVETAQPEKKPATETAPTKETSFSTDPCSSPSAKFLSTCR